MPHWPCVITLAVTCLVLPNFTTTTPGPEFSGSQLAFVAVASLALYAMFVVTQTVRHRDFFLPVMEGGELMPEDGPRCSTHEPASTAQPGPAPGLAAGGGRAGQDRVGADRGRGQVAGPAQAVVGVIIALLVLLPESIAAVNAARRDRTQISLNLGYGSAMASIGLTIPTIAVASIWLDGPLDLGLEPSHIVLLALTAVVSVLTVVPGRATRLQGGVHLVVLASYLVLSVRP